MVVFPNCKINLGLHVVSKRTDGFHNLETVFYPISWCDALEVVENKANKNDFEFTHSGLSISGSADQNLIYKAWELIRKDYTLPPIQVHLHKHIPMGAGLGGGSSDAAFFINLIDSKFNLAISYLDKTNIAKRIGSDCAFFLNNNPVYATGKGDEFSEIQLDLKEYFILVVYPNIHSNTKDAYSELKPKVPSKNLREILTGNSIEKWKDLLLNDFEEAIFKKYPATKAVKSNLYEQGALYASLSGSGSAVYGIFTQEPKTDLPKEFSYYLQKPLRKIL